MKNSDEPYDYKFVKWMTKNKVMFIGPYNIVLCLIVNLWRKAADMLWTMWTVALLHDSPFGYWEDFNIISEGRRIVVNT